jgi:hypothetical protein
MPESIPMNRFTFFRWPTQRASATNKRKALLAAVAPLVLALSLPIFAQTAATTTTTMTITSGGSAVSSVSSGTVVTLTATVLAGSKPVTVGVVNFCDATATYCEAPHIVGSAQLTSAGTAVLKFRPGVGSHSYKAVFVATTASFAGTATDASSSSAASALTVTGLTPTLTQIGPQLLPAGYQFQSYVYSPGSVAPTGNVQVLDTSQGNAVLASGPLAAVATELYYPVQAPGTVQTSELGVYAVGDFNGDGIPDLAEFIRNQPPGDGDTITIFLGNGDGSFTQGTQYTTTTLEGSPVAIAAADFNGDGKPDLVLVTTVSVQVWLGNGDGTFQALASTYSITPGQTPASVVVGDVNGDGFPDLVLLMPQDVAPQLLIGSGLGTFTPGAALSWQPAISNGAVETSVTAAGVVVGDFNGDGIQDLAVAINNEAVTAEGHVSFSSTVSIYLGTGGANFAPPTTVYSPPFALGPIAGGDFNGDGIQDLVVAISSSESAYSTASFIPLLGKGDGTFTSGTSLQPYNTSFVESLETADVNGGGVLDLVANSSQSGVVYLGKGDGTFTFGGGALPGAVAFADFNGDGLEDMLELGPSYPAGYQSGTVFLSETQAASFTASAIALTPTGAPHNVVASYPGDATHAPSESAPAVLPAQTAFTLATTANSVLYGQSFTLTATLSPYTGSGGTTDGETVTFLGGSGILGTGTLSGGVATLTVSNLAVGEYSIFAEYNGDAGFAASESNSVPVQVATGQGTLLLTSSASSSTYGNGVTLTATLTPSTYAGVSSNGTAIKFLVAGTNIVGTATLSSGVAQLTTTALPAGADQVTAVFPGDSTMATVTSAPLAVNVAQAPLTVTGPTLLRAYGVPNPPLTGIATGAVNNDQFTVSGTTTATLTSPPGAYPIVPAASGPDLNDYAVTTVNGTLTVTQPLPTISSVSASSNPAMAGAAVTFTVTVTSQNGTPTGTVTFLDGSTSLGTGTLASGSATYTTSSLAAGTHSITASYSGDTNFGAVTSGVLSEAIESFSVGGSSGGSTTQTASPGGTATYALSVTPPTVGNPITFSVTGLPTGATATFTPSSIPVGAGPTNVSLVVTLPSTAGAQPATSLLGNGVLPISLGLILLPFTGRLRKGSRRWLWIVILGVAGIAAMGACGGGGNSGGGGGGGATPQNYTLTVTATSGTLTQTTTLTLTVN